MNFRVQVKRYDGTWANRAEFLFWPECYEFFRAVARSNPQLDIRVIRISHDGSDGIPIDIHLVQKVFP